MSDMDGLWECYHPLSLVLRLFDAGKLDPVLLLPSALTMLDGKYVKDPEFPSVSADPGLTLIVRHTRGESEMPALPPGIRFPTRFYPLLVGRVAVMVEENIHRFRAEGWEPIPINSLVLAALDVSTSAKTINAFVREMAPDERRRLRKIEHEEQGDQK